MVNLPHCGFCGLKRPATKEKHLRNCFVSRLGLNYEAAEMEKKPAVCKPLTHWIYYSTKDTLITALHTEAGHRGNCQHAVKSHRMLLLMSIRHAVIKRTIIRQLHWPFMCIQYAAGHVKLSTYVRLVDKETLYVDLSGFTLTHHQTVGLIMLRCKLNRHHSHLAALIMQM